MNNCSSSGCRFDGRRARAITLAPTSVSAWREYGREISSPGSGGTPEALAGNALRSSREAFPAARLKKSAAVSTGRSSARLWL